MFNYACNLMMLQLKLWDDLNTFLMKNLSDF